MDIFISIVLVYATIDSTMGISENHGITLKNVYSEMLSIRREVNDQRQEIARLREKSQNQETQIQTIREQLREQEQCENELKEMKFLYKSDDSRKEQESNRRQNLQRDEVHKKINSFSHLDVLSSTTDQIHSDNDITNNTGTYTVTKRDGQQHIKTKRLTKHETTSQDKRLLLPTVTPSSEIVAFYAIMSKAEPNPSHHHVLAFDVVKTNVGNGYHSSSGVFVAPTTGVYIFFWSMRLDGTAGHSLELIANNDAVGAICLYTKGSNENVSGTVVVHVNEGDDVFVRTSSGCSGVNNIHSDPCGWSSFGGWKIN